MVSEWKRRGDCLIKILRLPLRRTLKELPFRLPFGQINLAFSDWRRQKIPSARGGIQGKQLNNLTFRRESIFSEMPVLFPGFLRPACPRCVFVAADRLRLKLTNRDQWQRVPPSA